MVVMFWVVMQCKLIHRYQYFWVMTPSRLVGGYIPLFRWKTCMLLRAYMTSQPRRTAASSSTSQEPHISTQYVFLNKMFLDSINPLTLNSYQGWKLGCDFNWTGFKIHFSAVLLFSHTKFKFDAWSYNFKWNCVWTSTHCLYVSLECGKNFYVQVSL